MLQIKTGKNYQAKSLKIVLTKSKENVKIILLARTKENTYNKNKLVKVKSKIKEKQQKLVYIFCTQKKVKKLSKKVLTKYKKCIKINLVPQEQKSTLKSKQ